MILLTDTRPSEPKELVELRSRGSVDRAATPQGLEDRVDAAYGARGDQAPGQAAGDDGDASGAAEAVGVLTAVDEDEEGAEDAELPHEFDYISDGENEME